MSTGRDLAEPWMSNDFWLLKAVRLASHRLVPVDVRFRWYFGVLETPILSELYVLGRGRLRNRRIQPDTALVIEGYPASGNTYCRQAFLLSNPDIDMNQVCSHTHSHRVVLRAVRAGLPCIVIARDPRDAVTSMMQRFGGIRLIDAIRYYEHYYRELFPVRNQLVVAPFSLVVNDFSSIIERVDEKFGVFFATQLSAGVTNDMVFRNIEERHRSKNQGLVEETRLARPSSSRKRSAEFLRSMTLAERDSMRDALATYDIFIGDC